MILIQQFTIALGTLFVILVVGLFGVLHVITSQSLEFGAFGALMLVDMIIFLVLGYRYKAIPSEDVENAD